MSNSGITELPEPGEVLTNKEIHQRFSVGNMGGMRKSNPRNLLVLISDPFKGLYEDRWEGDVLHYTGMGKIGDQSLTYSQNKTLDNSSSNGVVLHLVEVLEPQQYTYLGEVELDGSPYQEKQFDEERRERNVWMFPLLPKVRGIRPARTEQQARKVEESHAKLVSLLSIIELKERAEKSKKRPATKEITTVRYVRDAAVVEYSKRLANGVCDLCQTAAPFRNKRKEPYLECHHVTWLARGGEDTIENTVALCPNCHRRMHILDTKFDKEILLKRAQNRIHPSTV